MLPSKMSFLQFPYTQKIDPSAPYRKVHDEVLAVMSLADTPSVSTPNLIQSSEVLPSSDTPENFL